MILFPTYSFSSTTLVQEAAFTLCKMEAGWSAPSNMSMGVFGHRKYGESQGNTLLVL